MSLNMMMNYWISQSEDRDALQGPDLYIIDTYKLNSVHVAIDLHSEVILINNHNLVGRIVDMGVYYWGQTYVFLWKEACYSRVLRLLGELIFTWNMDSGGTSYFQDAGVVYNYYFCRLIQASWKSDSHNIGCPSLIS